MSTNNDFLHISHRNKGPVATHGHSTSGNVSPSRGRLPVTTLASALKSRSSPGVRLDLIASGYDK